MEPAPHPFAMRYDFPPLQSGHLLQRYKRFFADIQLDSGETITAHCPNTGPMTGVCLPGNRVWVSQNDDPKRKLKYTWELIEVADNEPICVGTNTSLPNRVMAWVLEHRLIPELGDYTTIQSEVKYGAEGKSRVDFVLSSGDLSTGDPSELGVANRPIYLEVKNTTWVQGRLALFPDTVTTRGQKHIRELQALLPDTRAVMLYFINRGDCDSFAPGDAKDPVYGQLLRAAVQQGLEVLPCRFGVTPEGVEYLGLASLQL